MENRRKTNKRKLVIVTCCAIVLFSALFIQMIITPISRPSPMVIAYVQRHTPIGTYIDDVVEIIRDNENWWHRYSRRTQGVRRHDLQGNPYILGSKYVTVYAGNYFPGSISTFFLPTLVHIYWVFDDDGELFHIFVQRSLAL